MKREIKFRAWSKKYGMVYSDNHRTVWCGGVEVSVNTDHGKLMDEFEPMQFTGLQDKNKIDVYEGDIVKMRDALFEGFSDSGIPDNPNEKYSDFVSDVFFSDGMFCVHEPNTGSDAPVDYNGKVEIIGNIYENPQLLVDKI